MMKIYKLTVRPLTSFRTPLQSDTIFGHLLWALRYTEGEDALVAFLNRYRDGEPPLLVSAGFPAGTLPVPVLQPGQKKDEEAEEGDKPSLADEVVMQAPATSPTYPVPTTPTRISNSDDGDLTLGAVRKGHL